MLNEIIGKYIIDSRKLRLSFGKTIYIPEEVMNGLGLTGINVEDLPLKIKYPGKLLIKDCRDYPCKGWVCNIEKYNESLMKSIGEELEEVPFTKRCFLGYDETTIHGKSSRLVKMLKLQKESMTFYVARIPLLQRYILDKEHYRNSTKVTIATKSIVIEGIISIDYRTPLLSINI